MPVSRRGFMKTGSIAAICAGIPLEFLNVASARQVRGGVVRAPGKSGSLFMRSTFTPHVNTTFHVRLGDGRVVDLTLVEAEDLGRSGDKPSDKGERFALRFEAAHAKKFPQGIYTFEHEELGTSSLFVAPVDRPTTKVTYEAIVNRMRA
jgi:hypothetical protein